MKKHYLLLACIIPIFLFIACPHTPPPTNNDEEGATIEIIIRSPKAFSGLYSAEDGGAGRFIHPLASKIEATLSIPSLSNGVDVAADLYPGQNVIPLRFFNIPFGYALTLSIKIKDADGKVLGTAYNDIPALSTETNPAIEVGIIPEVEEENVFKLYDEDNPDDFPHDHMNLGLENFTPGALNIYKIIFPQTGIYSLEEDYSDMFSYLEVYTANGLPHTGLGVIKNKDGSRAYVGPSSYTNSSSPYFFGLSASKELYLMFYTSSTMEEGLSLNFGAYTYIENSDDGEIEKVQQILIGYPPTEYSNVFIPIQDAGSIFLGESTPNFPDNIWSIHERTISIHNPYDFSLTPQYTLNPSGNKVITFIDFPNNEPIAPAERKEFIIRFDPNQEGGSISSELTLTFEEIDVEIALTVYGKIC